MRRSKLIQLMLVALMMLLSACNLGKNELLPTETVSSSLNSPTDEKKVTSALTPAPTQPLGSILTICTAADPIIDNQVNDILKTILYPSLFSKDIKEELIFFEFFPSWDNGGLIKIEVPVKEGQIVLNSHAEVVQLYDDELIISTGMEPGDAPLRWGSGSEAIMTSVQAIFRLNQGLQWSNGKPLIADDFVLGYSMAKADVNIRDSWVLDRTDSLEALDNHTLVWTGIPGFEPGNVEALLRLPFPSHASTEVSSMSLGEVSNLSPLGWGSYQIATQVNDILILEKNPHYFLDKENALFFDFLSIRIEPNRDKAIDLFTNNTCDVLDPSYRLEELEKSELEALSKVGNLINENSERNQHLVFGIQPAIYDIYDYNPWIVKRQDFFGSLAVRQALAACIDPQRLFTKFLEENFPKDMPTPEFTTIQTGINPNEVLEEYGWAISDGNVRIAEGVPDILDGTELSLRLTTTNSLQNQRIAELIAENLLDCGVRVEIQSLAQESFFQPGPVGVVFGRAFDLAMVPMNDNACSIYLSNQTPNAFNGWVGTNLAGFSNPGFDQLCQEMGVSEDKVEMEQMQVDLLERYLPSFPILPQVNLWAHSNNLIAPEGIRFSGFWKLTPMD